MIKYNIKSFSNFETKVRIILQEVKVIDIDLDFFIKAVEENNHNNNGKWSDLASADEIIETYTSTENIKYNFIDDIDFIKYHLEYMIRNFK